MLGALVSLLLFAPSALAFDPFTVLATASAVGSAASSVIEHASNGKAAADGREFFSALGELSDEIVPEGTENDPGGMAKKIAAIERAAREAGYTKEEIDSLLEDARQSNQNAARTLRLLSRSIRFGKRMALMTGLTAKDKAAHAVSVTNLQGSEQERKILTDIYGELVNQRLDEKKRQIEEQKRHQEEYQKLRLFVLALAPSGNVALFPVDSSVIQKAIDVYRAYAWILLVLVGSIFMIRVVYYQMSFAGSERYADLLRDVFACYFLVIAFPYVYSYMAECAAALSLKLSELLHVTGMKIPELLKVDQAKSFWWLRWEVIQLVLYVAVYFVFNLVLAILIACGPIVILMGTMMNFTFSLTAYLTLLVLVWLWPAFWNVLGYFKGVLWAGKAFSLDGIGSTIASLVLYGFQLVSPVAIGMVLKNTPVGQAASKAASNVGARASRWTGLGNAPRTEGPLQPLQTPKGGSSGGSAKGHASSSKLFAARRQQSRAGILTGRSQYDL